MLVRALCMSNERKRVPASRAGGNSRHHKLPKNARACRFARMSRQAYRVSKANARASLWIWSLQLEKTLGLDHRNEFERLPDKILHEAWDVGGVDIDGMHAIQLWPPGQRRPTDPLGLWR